MSTIDSPQIISKEDAVQLLDSSTKPCIFWDTCSLLDIIRLPLPERNQSVDRLEKVMAMRQKVVNGEILSLASILTVKEFNYHVGHTKDTLVREARRISQEYNKYLEFVKRANPTVTDLDKDLVSYNLEILVNDIVQDIVVQTKFIANDDLFLQEAQTRVLEKIPPASKKGEFKDCYIWATCLTVRQMSQRTGHPFGFLSSNVRDYTESRMMQFNPYIAAEATAAEIIYYPNFDVAYGSLAKAGAI